jgi:hypothetical protein
MKDYTMVNLYPDENELTFTSIVKSNLLVDDVKIKYGMNTQSIRRFILYKFEGYPEFYKINLMVDESTPAQMDNLFLKMVEYIYQQVKIVDKETYLDFTEEGLSFYNFWINKFKGLKNEYVK